MTFFQGRMAREREIPLTISERPDGVYFHAQQHRWKIRFGGADRFETFGIEEFDAANTLFKLLQAGGEP